MSAIAEALATVNVSVIERELLTATQAIEQVELVAVLLEGLGAGAAVAEDAGIARVAARRGATLIRTAQLTTRFDRTNPVAIAWAEEHAAALVTHVTETTRQQLREAVTRMFREGIPPRRAAQQLRDLIGLTPAQGRNAARFLERALTAEPGQLLTIGKRTIRVPDGGLGEQRAAKLYRQYVDRQHRRRAQLIARTEASLAANHGQHLLWHQAVQARELSGREVRVWMAWNPCAICAALDGQKAGLFEAFPGGFTHPPAHPACKCTVGLTGELGPPQVAPLQTTAVEPETPPEPPWPLADEDVRIWTLKAKARADALEDRHRAWVEAVRASDAYDAMNAYTASSGMFNTRLRDLPVGAPASQAPGIGPQAQAIMDAIATAPTPPPVVWRGLSGSVDEVAEWSGVARLEPGNRLVLKGFQSTTLKPHLDFIEDADLVLEIVPKRGAYIRPLSQFKQEYEYLLEHGATYRVRAIKELEFVGTGGEDITKTVIQLIQE